MKIRFMLSFAAVALSACASSSVTPISQNQFLLNTSAEPACGISGAYKVASKMAAVETLRRGYDRYLIVGSDSENNVTVASLPRTGAYTTATVTSYGNTAYGSANTSYYGGGPIVMGSNDAQLAVVMLKPNDTGYQNALVARQELGADWQKLVKDGVNTCN